MSLCLKGLFGKAESLLTSIPIDVDTYPKGRSPPDGNLLSCHKPPAPGPDFMLDNSLLISDELSQAP